MVYDGTGYCGMARYSIVWYLMVVYYGMTESRVD